MGITRNTEFVTKVMNHLNKAGHTKRWAVGCHMNPESNRIFARNLLREKRRRNFVLMPDLGYEPGHYILDCDDFSGNLIVLIEGIIEYFIKFIQETIFKKYF